VGAKEIPNFHKGFPPMGFLKKKRSFPCYLVSIMRKRRPILGITLFFPIKHTSFLHFARQPLDIPEKDCLFSKYFCNKIFLKYF
jgi:hypothetical protein